MSASPIKDTIQSAVKDAMRAKDKPRLATLRLITAEFKRIEVDERIELDDARVLAVLDKMTKQRRDSIAQFKEASRDDLAEQEQQELAIIKIFLPEPFTDEELKALISEAIASTSAEGMKDMGKVMGVVKPKIQGRADMGAASAIVKSLLG